MGRYPHMCIPQHNPSPTCTVLRRFFRRVRAKNTCQNNTVCPRSGNTTPAERRDIDEDEAAKMLTGW